MAKKVVVGMSGGVDSSVAAYLLKQQGYDVIGVTMQIWQTEEQAILEEENGGCCGLSAVEDARRVAQCLDIPYYVMNFKDVFKCNVMDYFVDEYLHARTPNPCIACNRYVKWEALLNRSLEIGADYIATGHYALVEQLENGRYALKTSKTLAKDQTYALYNLTQFQLSKTLMPVGHYEKEEIRKIAEEANLPVAHKPDSQDICFIPEGDYNAFLEEEVGKKNLPGPGNFVDKNGKILGKHSGLTHYTIGQRKGLNIALGHPVFVTELRAKNNEVVLGENADCFTDSLLCNQLNYMMVDKLEGPTRVWAKIRYSHRGEWCILEEVGPDTVKCTFENPVRAVTPGQAVVFYQDQYVFGGGTIIC